MNYCIDAIIPTDAWRIKGPREVMRRFLGTSRFVPELTLEERREFLKNAIGRKDIPIHVELPVRTR